MARLGEEGVLNYKVGGFAAGGSFAELTKARNVTLQMTAGLADISARDNDGWKAEIATLKELSVNFELVWEPGDAGVEAIRDAFLNRDIIGLQVLDTDSGEGPEGDFTISDFSRSEQLEEAMIISVTAKLSVFNEWVS